MSGYTYTYDPNEDRFNPNYFYVNISTYSSFWYSKYPDLPAHLSYIKPFGLYNVKLDKSEYAVFPIKYISKLKLLLRQVRSRLRKKYYNIIYNSSSFPDDICKYITTFLF
jgi:hypothetical protein